MKPSRLLHLGPIIACCLFASGCFSIEQEIFLNADGSGELVIFISLPDLPEKMDAAGAKTTKRPDLADFQRDITKALPPSITLKEAKELKRNGVQSLYAVFQFKQLDDVKRVLANLGKGSLSPGEVGSDPQWSLDIRKRGNTTHYSQSFIIDVDSKAEASVKGETKPGGKSEPESPEAAKASKEMEEQLKPIVLSIIRMRFVLHTPSPITDTNADIVLNKTTAVWNCSLAAFAKDKKAIEMKAAF